jgi:hypothetical protein
MAGASEKVGLAEPEISLLGRASQLKVWLRGAKEKVGLGKISLFCGAVQLKILLYLGS